MPMRDRLARLVRRTPQRPTLRQRAAALKASAAKAMRRPMPAVVPAPAAEQPAASVLYSRDPIFAAIAEARRLQAARDTLWQACQDLPDAAPEWAPEREAYAAWFAHIDNVLMQTVPTTAAGCVALARFVVDFCSEQGISITHGMDAASVDNIGPLRLIAQSPALVGPGVFADPSEDPVFAAIEAHAAARAAFGDTVDASDRAWVRQHGGDTSDAAMAPAVAANEAADAAEEEAWAALLQTRPTTIAGLLSFTQHVARYASEHDQGAPAGAPEPAPAAIASALSHVLAGAGEREAVDWHDAPPGFMAFPVFEPIGFRRILDALPEEVTRLHRAASTDLARRMACVGADVPEEERQQIEAQFRQALMLPALTAAADPESDGARALAALDAVEAAGHDAELIALGRQFDAAHAAWMALVPAGDAARARVEAFSQRAVAEGMEEVAALKAAWLQDGVNEAHEAEEAAFEALQPLNEAILALPAHTAEGLAVKARATIVAMWPAGSFEADRRLGDDENWERRIVRDLIDACVTLARRRAVGGLPADGRIEKAGTLTADGMVLYEDAAGTLARKPVASWVNFMAQRLYGIASKELSRQYDQQCGDDAAANDALWSGLQRDLRLDALRDLAFRSHAVFEAAEARRREGEEAPAGPAAPALPDLSKLTILQLRNLYDRYVQVSDIWNDALHAPWANDPEGAGLRGPNAAGDLIEEEQTRMCGLYAAVVAEISGRKPSDDRESNWQLETLIRHELMCNSDLREAPELRAAIAERWSA